MENVTFTADPTLGRAGTTWTSWGVPSGTASTGPLPHPWFKSQIYCACSVYSAFPHRNQGVQSALLGRAGGGGGGDPSCLGLAKDRRSYCI